jgi:uncharacterized protein
MSEQPVINSLEFARKGGTLRGKVSVAALPRVSGLLSSRDGEVHYELSGRINEAGKPVLQIKLQGSLRMVCQRCLEEMEYPLATETELELVADENGLKPVEEESEAVDTIVADKEMDVVSLVEEDILLEMPMSPKHPEGGCGDAGKVPAQPKSNAFSALAALKK